MVAKNERISLTKLKCLDRDIMETAREAERNISCVISVESGADEEYYRLEVVEGGNTLYNNEFERLADLYKHLNGIYVGLCIGLGQEV